MNIDVSKVPLSVLWESARTEVLNTVNSVKANYAVTPDHMRGILYEALAINEQDALRDQAAAYGKMLTEMKEERSKDDNDQ